MTRHKMGDEDIARMIDIIGDGELTVEAQKRLQRFWRRWAAPAASLTLAAIRRVTVRPGSSSK